MFETDEPGQQVHFELERLSMLSVAKLFAVLYGAFFAIFGVLYGLMIGAVSVFGAIQGEPEALIGLAVAAGVMIVMPLMYAVFAAVMGAMMAGLYNLVAGRIGGFRVTLRVAEETPL